MKRMAQFNHHQIAVFTRPYGNKIILLDNGATC